MKKTRWMVITGIVLLGVSVVLTVLFFYKFFTMAFSVFEDGWTESALIGDILAIYGLLFGQLIGYSTGLLLVIFGAIYGKRLDKREAKRAEVSENVSFTNELEYKPQNYTLADVQIVNTNQLLIDGETIDMTSISKLYMDREQIRFRTNNKEYIISYQNSSEAVFLVGRIKQYSK